LPIINGQRITKEEIKLLQLSSTDMTNEVIAEEMNLCLGTFHKLKKHVYAWLGIQTKQEGVPISYFHNFL
jgi:DNA-binding NarL/FixJ family response regulator